MSDGGLILVFWQGTKANQRGQGLADNPHPDGTAEHETWREAWLEEEGPLYTLGRGGSYVLRNPTLLDVWPFPRSDPCYRN